MTEHNLVGKQESNRMSFFYCEGNCQDNLGEGEPKPKTQRSSVIAMQFLNLPMLLSSKPSNTVQYDNTMLKLPFKVYLGLKCQSISFLPLYINQKMIVILRLIMLKDTVFKTFKLVFLVSYHL